MTARLTFLAILGCWVTMNGLLWHAEFGTHAGDTPVPVALVWKRILTAPDASSLSVFQNRKRIGFCEFSTAIGQQMAALDDSSPPPEGLAASAGQQIHLAGNVAFGDFTNRVKFDGRVRFDADRRWQELDLKISSALMLVEIRALATNQSVHIKLTGDGTDLERNLTLADLQNPSVLLRAFAGDVADPLGGVLELPALVPAPAAQTIHWDARRTRVKIGAESVPIYRLETSVLGRDVTVDVSTLGELLRVELPGNFIARIDEWSNND